MVDNTIINIEVDNTDSVLRELEARTDRILEVWGGKVETYAKELTPVDTGSLRTSLRHKKKDENTMEVIAGGDFFVKNMVDYAVYVEMGTSKTRAQPYLRPACENHIDEYKKIIESELKK